MSFGSYPTVEVQSSAFGDLPMILGLGCAYIWQARALVRLRRYPDHVPTFTPGKLKMGQPAVSWSAGNGPVPVAGGADAFSVQHSLLNPQSWPGEQLACSVENSQWEKSCGNILMQSSLRSVVR